MRFMIYAGVSICIGCIYLLTHLGIPICILCRFHSDRDMMQFEFRILFLCRLRNTMIYI